MPGEDVRVDGIGANVSRALVSVARRQRGGEGRLTATALRANRRETNQDRIGDVVRFGICSPQDIVSHHQLTTIPKRCSARLARRCSREGEAP